MKVSINRTEIKLAFPNKHRWLVACDHLSTRENHRQRQTTTWSHIPQGHLPQNTLLAWQGKKAPKRQDRVPVGATPKMKRPSRARNKIK